MLLTNSFNVNFSLKTEKNKFYLSSNKTMSTYTTPTQWELFAQSMADDIDKINEKLYKIFDVVPPPKPSEPEFVRTPRSPKKKNTSARFKRSFPQKTQQEIISEIRKSDSDEPKTNYTSLPARGNGCARIFKPKLVSILPYSTTRDVTPVITGDTLIPDIESACCSSRNECNGDCEHCQCCQHSQQNNQ